MYIVHSIHRSLKKRNYESGKYHMQSRGRSGIGSEGSLHGETSGTGSRLVVAPAVYPSALPRDAGATRRGGEGRER